MAETFYRMCTLARGHSLTTGWIEERGARVGAEVELMSDNGNLWTVEQVSDKRLPQSQLRFMQAANKHASLT